jgi:hypothetical protein
MTEYTLEDQIATLRKQSERALDMLNEIMVAYMDRCTDLHIRPDWDMFWSMTKVADILMGLAEGETEQQLTVLVETLRREN